MCSIWKSGIFCRKIYPTESSGLYHRSSHSLQKRSGEQNIESYMSNTFLGRMRATGQLKEAPVSKGFFERYKKKSKKAKKGVKIEPKKEGDKQLNQLKFVVGKKD